MQKIKANRSKLEDNGSTSDHIITILTYIFYALFALACVYPFYYMFINTISSNDLSQKGEILFLPKAIHFDNYISVFKLPDLLNAAWISLARTVLGTALPVFSAGFLGFMFTRKTLWKRQFCYRFIIVTMYFNAGVIPWYLTMRNLNLTNNFWGYVLPAIVAPFNVILAKTFVESVPRELQEAAEIDGAGTLTVFFRIMLPVIVPIMTTIAIFSAVGQWNAFQDTLLLMTDKKYYTLQYLLYQYINQAGSLKALMATSSSASGSGIEQSLATVQTATSIRMTVSIVVVAPILLVYPFFQRYFVKGIMIGAVKG